jgi:hypothetical protein
LVTVEVGMDATRIRELQAGRTQMSGSDSSENPIAPRPNEVAPHVSALGPSDYKSVPWYRRHGCCEPIIGAHALVMFLGLFIPLVARLGVCTWIGAIAICIVALTGPIYYNERNPDGTLRIWSKGNKVAAVIILVVFVGGYGALIYYLNVSGQLAILTNARMR